MTLNQGKKGTVEGSVSNSSLSSPINKNKLSEEDTRKIYILKKTYDGILDELQQLDIQEDKIVEQKADYIRELARCLEKIYILYGQEEEINTISVTIKQSIHQDRKLKISDDLIEYALDQKYKRDHNTASPEKQQASKTTLELAADNYIRDAQSMVQVDTLDTEGGKSWDELTRDEVRERLERLGKTKKDVSKLNRVLGEQVETGKEEAKKRGIAYDTEKVEEDKDVISAGPLLSGYSRYAKAEEEYIELRKRILQKIIKYKPLTDKQANDLAEIMELQIELDKPLADEKYRADIVQWFINGANEVAMGKHASAEAYKYVIPKKTLKELEAMGEDVIKIATDPEGNPHIEFDERSIVREQVGDVKEAIQRLAARVLMLFPKYVATHSWFISHPGWSIAKRAYDASDKLSRAA